MVILIKAVEMDDNTVNFFNTYSTLIFWYTYNRAYLFYFND